MNEIQGHKKLAALMCVIFASHLTALMYGMYAFEIMYNIGPKVFNIVNIILELPIIVSAYFIASKNELFITNNAKVATWTFFGFQIFSLVNTLCYLLFDKNILGGIGQSSHIILPTLFACSTVWFYASLQMWRPVKIAGIISAFSPIASGILLYQIVGKDYSDDLLHVFRAIGTTVWINAALYAITLLLSIIWSLRKPLAPHAQSNPINII